MPILAVPHPPALAAPAPGWLRSLPKPAMEEMAPPASLPAGAEAIEPMLTRRCLRWTLGLAPTLALAAPTPAVTEASREETSVANEAGVDADCGEDLARIRAEGFLARSASFRELIAELAALPGLEVHVRFVPRSSAVLRSSARRGETRWGTVRFQVHRPEGATHFEGTVHCFVVAGPGAAAVLGHELRHALELALFGDIRRAPRVREAAAAAPVFESEGAIEIERAIRSEVARPARAERVRPR